MKLSIAEKNTIVLALEILCGMDKDLTVEYRQKTYKLYRKLATPWEFADVKKFNDIQRTKYI